MSNDGKENKNISRNKGCKNKLCEKIKEYLYANYSHWIGVLDDI